MTLFYSLTINFFILLIFFAIGNIFNNCKFLINNNKKILFGFSLFVIVNYLLFFTFNFTIKLNLLFLLCAIFLITIYYFISKKVINIKTFLLDIFKYILPISVLYVFTTIFYGEQFYVFRGNHWDLFSYLSIASLFNEVSFGQVLTGDIPNYFYHFQDIKKLSLSRPLTSYLLGLFLNIKIIDIYLLVFLFKTLFVILSTISVSNLINELNIENHKEKYFISMAFPFSFWLIYIFEIDALAHLVSLPVFILVISETFTINRYVKKNDNYYLVYFSIINSALFLLYPEIFIISSLIFFICICVEIYENKSLGKKYFIYFFKVSLIFLSITLFAFKTNYVFLYEQSNIILSSTRDWWGYFGAFILGKENLVLDRSIVLTLEEFVSKNNILNSLDYIINLHLQKGYDFFYFNIFPSLFGLYYLTVGKIENFYSYIHLFFLLILSYFLILQIIKNFVVFKTRKKIILNLIIFFLLFTVLFLKGNIWSIIKLYFYLSPFIFLLLVFKFKKSKKKILSKTSYLFIIFLILFPIYKYSSFNNGVGRLDSFPSILNYKIKSNFIWEVKLDRLKKCNYINLDVGDYIKKSYLILKLKHSFSNINFDTDYVQYNENINICQIKIKRNKFIYEN